MNAWSFSSLKMFKTCPRQYYELRVARNFKREDNEMSLYGNDLHAVIENYVNDKVAIPEGFAFLQPVVDALLAKRGKKHAELELAVTADITPCAYDSRRAWCRGIIDLLIVSEGIGWLVDFKSGNAKYPDKDQLTLMSLLAMAHYPELAQVNSALVFVLKDTIIKHKVMRVEENELWWHFREEVARIDKAHETQVWNPQQSGLCKRHCVVVTCPFNGRHYLPWPSEGTLQEKPSASGA